MANIDSNLANWSGTAASNQPDTTDTNTIVADLRQIQATIRNYLASRGTKASGTTVDLSTVTSLIVSVTHSTGTTAISSFGTVSAGIWKMITFAVSGGTLTLTYDATQMIIPGAANVTIGNGDSLIAESLGSGNWKIHSYTPAVAISTAFKIGTFTRDISTASGTQAITGVGFKPRLVLFLAATNATTTMSVGFDDGVAPFGIGDDSVDSAGSYFLRNTESILAAQASGSNAVGHISAFGADGFTITWTKTGTPVNTLVIGYLAFR